MKKNIIYFSLGCFWQIQEIFSNKDGVLDTIVGYMGGNKKNPTYSNVCKLSSKHIETIKIVYDENIISLDNLLDIYFNIYHNNKNETKQKYQYSKLIYYSNNNEKNKILKYLQKNNLKNLKMIVKKKKKNFIKRKTIIKTIIKKTHFNIMPIKLVLEEHLI